MILNRLSGSAWAVAVVVLAVSTAYVIERRPSARTEPAAALAEMSAASLTQVSAAVLDAESRAGLLPAQLGRRSAQREGGPIADDGLRRPLAERWSATIADGIDAATKAVAIDREYEGAMLTLEGWHQLAADLAASPDEYRRHMNSADEWRHKALAARRLKAERSSQ